MGTHSGVINGTNCGDTHTHTHIHVWSMCEVGLCIKNEEVTLVFTFVMCKHAYAFGGGGGGGGGTLGRQAHYSQVLSSYTVYLCLMALMVFPLRSAATVTPFYYLTRISILLEMRISIFP